MHQVVALNANGAPASVICRTCGNQHKYHEKKEPSSSTSSGTTTRRVRASAEPARDAPVGPSRPYSPKEVYTSGEWVDHPKFGQGKIMQARAGKIEVRFDSGNRLLLHAG
ncbi:MAG TPA: hypothetical protein VF297_26660 [Pyrinomonadaceae bacterium]